MNIGREAGRRFGSNSTVLFSFYYCLGFLKVERLRNERRTGESRFVLAFFILVFM